MFQTRKPAESIELIDISIYPKFSLLLLLFASSVVPYLVCLVAVA